jgi:hypothetical protein
VLRLFAQRVALPGGGGVLARLNDAAEGLRLGTAVLNHASGSVRANRRVRYPDADPDQLGRVRRTCWQRRAANSAPPSVFAGYAEQHLADDPALGSWTRWCPGGARCSAVRRCRMPSAGVTLDGSPGRNLGVLGALAGADVLHAAVLSLARQHEPGRAEFVLAGLVPAADAAARQLPRESCAVPARVQRRRRRGPAGRARPAGAPARRGRRRGTEEPAAIDEPEDTETSEEPEDTGPRSYRRTRGHRGHRRTRRTRRQPRPSTRPRDETDEDETAG